MRVAAAGDVLGYTGGAGRDGVARVPPVTTKGEWKWDLSSTGKTAPKMSNSQRNVSSKWSKMTTVFWCQMWTLHATRAAKLGKTLFQNDAIISILA